MAFKLKFKVHGNPTRKFSAFQERALNALHGGLVDAAEMILARAQQYAPVDTGFLRDSGFVGEPRAHMNNPTVNVGFGARYAERVHETHPTHGKFLQRAFDEVFNSAMATLKRSIKRGVKDQRRITRSRTDGRSGIGSRAQRIRARRGR